VRGEVLTQEENATLDEFLAAFDAEEKARMAPAIARYEATRAQQLFLMEQRFALLEAEIILLKQHLALVD
jgi:hypothetical protein